jgi:putative transposase
MDNTVWREDGGQCPPYRKTMADYRRADQPGGTYFFTLVTYERRPIFADAAHVGRLRAAAMAVMNERPFEFVAAVVLPDHAHYLWTLPAGDADFSTRIGRMKALFTKSLATDGEKAPPHAGWAPAAATIRPASRVKHRDADVWQRRFWEHLIRGRDDLNRHLDYIHYNPVKHGYVSCPHAWPASSFNSCVDTGWYEPDWCCRCAGRAIHPPDFTWATADME